MAEKEQKLDKTEEKESKQEEGGDASTDAKSTGPSDAKKTPKKSPAKTPVKEKKPKAKPKKVSSDEEDESDDEELVGTLDQPLVVEGKRDRKSTEFLVSSFKTPQSAERKQVIIPMGKGETLGSMPRVEFQLKRIVAGDLKPLHRVLFGRAGVNSEVKRNIRNFNGFDIEKGSQEYKKKLESVDRFTLDSLRRLAEILDVERKGKKEELLERVMDFLMKPKASGNPVPEPKKKTPSVKKGQKRKRTKKQKKGSPKKKSEETVESDKEDDDDEEGGEENEEKEEKEEKEAKEPPKKKKKVSEPKKETKAKKETKKSPKKEKKVVPIKISPGKKGKKAKKEATKHDSDSSDDEPLVKKKKKSPPTDNEIVELVKELLDGADLEKVTMKSVCKQVFDRFPDFDLTGRKDFIKETVKKIIT